MPEEIPTGSQLRDGIDLHPRHESWARITTHTSFVGFVSLLALVALFVFVIELPVSWRSLAVLGVLAALILLGLVW